MARYGADTNPDVVDFAGRRWLARTFTLCIQRRRESRLKPHMRFWGQSSTILPSVREGLKAPPNAAGGAAGCRSEGWAMGTGEGWAFFILSLSILVAGVGGVMKGEIETVLYGLAGIGIGIIGIALLIRTSFLDR
jgi:hypothetical protein